MDISDTLAPKSDQLDAVELVGSPRTFTIEGVTAGNAEQPINVHLAEFPRPWRPGKSMRRVLAAGWGTDASKWVGQRVTLYCDPSVQFGGEQVGGTRISHMSGIDGPLRVPLLVKRGKSSTFTVQPLTEPAPAPQQQARRDYFAEAKAAATPAEFQAIRDAAQQAGAPDHYLAAIDAIALAPEEES